MRKGRVFREQIPQYYTGDMSVTIHSKPGECFSANELESVIQKWFEKNYNLFDEISNPIEGVKQ